MPDLNNAARNLAMNAIAEPDLNGALMQFYSGAPPASPNVGPTGTLLAQLVLGSPAFGAAVNGNVTANPIAGGTAMATGTAGYMRVTGATVVADFTVSVTGGGGEVQLPTLAFVSGEPVSCASFVWIQPQ